MEEPAASTPSGAIPSNCGPGELRYRRGRQMVELEHRETETWIREEARAIHISEESYIDPRLRSVVSIFRVPNFLKELKNRAYVPQMVSLGPYHSNGSANLCGMDHQKRRALRRMSTRFNENFIGVSDDMEFSVRAIDEIFKDADKIKDCYEEQIEWEPKRLAVMLTLDGCFILEILRTLAGNNLRGERLGRDKYEPILDGCFILEILRTLAGDNIRGEQLGRDKYEPIFERNKVDFTGFDILNDLLILENQIPLIVLRKLLQLELNSVHDTENFLFDVLVRSPGNKLYPFDYERDIRNWPQPPLHEEAHLLGLLYTLIVSPHRNDGESDCAIQVGNNRGMDNTRFPTAVELSNAGIKFSRRDGGIKKIRFDGKKATMYLPPINVTDHTEVLFRNLIAYELCKASEINSVTCYLSLMSNLIGTEKDVALLRNCDIINNYLGSDSEVAQLFHGLCKGVTLPRKFVFENLHNDVIEHYRSNVKVWIAQFVKEHFSSPWNILALLGAIIALLLSSVQTVFSILQVYKK